MLKRAFTEHPASVGESYTQHMGMAFGFGARMVFAGFACLLHGLFPFAFKCTGRKCIEELYYRMVTHRDRRECANAAAAMPDLAPSQTRIKPAE
ncbi:MAG: DUF6356 family protein [Pseudomonadota bacterium]